MKEEISLDIAMSKEEMAKIKELLTSSPGLRHYAFQLKNGEYLDLVEYKDYEKLEEENKSLQSQLKEKEEAIEKAIEKINDYKIYCKENKGFTEYTDIEIEAIEPVISKLEDILREVSE